jgi:Transposase IS200 like
VDRNHNVPGSRTLDADLKRAALESEAMTQAPYLLDERARPTVLEAIREVCRHRNWTLLAAHVRTNHTHVIVEAEAKPEKIMNDFKSYASRALTASSRITRGGAGRTMGALGGCGTIRMSGMLFDMSLRSRESQWLSLSLKLSNGTDSLTVAAG